HRQMSETPAEGRQDDMKPFSLPNHSPLKTREMTNRQHHGEANLVAQADSQGKAPRRRHPGPKPSPPRNNPGKTPPALTP
ncbi:hypothetical protein, partial [Frateuria defendens]|uniref:hypothetical protein n=1 Tax=Frateuria defendens TaxID=2219559 RepID=UPI001F38DC09